MFIVFEGIDGSGKTTISKMLAKDINAFWTCEPSDSPIGDLIKKILTKKIQVDNKTLALLFSADRVEHTGLIKKKLNENKDVVCDRYFYSSIAYQSVAGVDEDFILSINRYVIEPDIVFLLIVDVDIALKRIMTDDVFEKKDFLIKVQDKYIELSKKYNFVVVDTSHKSIEDVYSEILEYLHNKV